MSTTLETKLNFQFEKLKIQQNNHIFAMPKGAVRRRKPGETHSRSTGKRVSFSTCPLQFERETGCFPLLAILNALAQIPKGFFIFTSMIKIDHTKESVHDGVGVSKKRYLQIFEVCETAILEHTDALSALDYAQKAIKPKNSSEYFLIGFTFVDILSQLDCLNHSKTN